MLRGHRGGGIVMKKERDRRNAGLRAEVEGIRVESRDWLVLHLMDIQQELRALDITAGQHHLQELLETAAED